MKRGDVYLADLLPRSGSEQTGRRPAIIISHDGFNLTPGWRSVVVVPVSTPAAQASRGLTAVALPRRAGGLTHDSVALCHQITTLERSKLIQRLGALSPQHLHQVEQGIKAALDLRSGDYTKDRDRWLDQPDVDTLADQIQQWRAGRGGA